MSKSGIEECFTDSDGEEFKNAKTGTETESISSGNVTSKRKRLVSYCDDTYDDSLSEENEEVIARSCGGNDSKGSSFDIFPESSGECCVQLQNKIRKMMKKMEDTKCDWNRVIQERKSFRNPSIYEKLIEYCGINEVGTNYVPEVYDPTKWGEESFYEELRKVQKSEIDMRKKKKTKVEIVVGSAKKCDVNKINKEAAMKELVEGNNKLKKGRWDKTGKEEIFRSKSLMCRVPQPVLVKLPLELQRKTESL